VASLNCHVAATCCRSIKATIAVAMAVAVAVAATEAMPQAVAVAHQSHDQ